MADTSTIEWTDATWNPVTGCDRVSPGCAYCYALKLAARLKAMGSPHYQRDGDPRTSGPGFGVSTHEDALAIPLKWRSRFQYEVKTMLPDGTFYDGRTLDQWLAGTSLYYLGARPKSGGRQLDGREWNELPSRAAVPA